MMSAHPYTRKQKREAAKRAKFRAERITESKRKESKVYRRERRTDYLKGS